MDRAPEERSAGKLLAEWAAGSRAAGEALLGLLLPGVYGLCRRILGTEVDAEEAAQETFARLCTAVRRGEKLEDLRKWVATVAMNLCFDMRRRRSREIPVEPGNEVAEESEPLWGVDREKLARSIETLPDRYRAVLYHRFVLDLKPREIAEVMGLEEGTARVLLHRALSALRRRMKEGDEP